MNFHYLPITPSIIHKPNGCFMNKNHKNTIIYLAAMVVALLLGACSDDMFEEGGQQHGNDRIQLSGDIDQLAVTRVNDNGFCNGDVMGVYIVDYDGGTPGTLAQWKSTGEVFFVS